MVDKLDERGEPLSVTHDAERTTFSARETRQAGMGRRVFLVLAASVALVLLAWEAVELTSRGTGDQSRSEGSVTALQAQPK